MEDITMGRIKVLAIKITSDIHSIKVAYEGGDGKLYVRSGMNGFKVGQPVQGSIESLGKWGFRKVINPPYFSDGSELHENIGKFQLKVNGEVTYTG
jgi:hypothetical protein